MHTPQLTILRALFLLIFVFATYDQFKQRPVIGIVSSPEQDTSGKSYIKTIYTDFIFSGGGEVVPIPWNAPRKEVEKLLGQINGVLLTGGMAPLWDEDPTTLRKSWSEFGLFLKFVIDYVVEQNKKGHHYPIYGICQGMEALGIILSDDIDGLDLYENFGEYQAVDFTPLAKESRMYKYLTDSQFESLRENKGLYFWHEFSFNESFVKRHKDVFGPDKFLLTSYARDINDKVLINSMESIEYPIFMVMFHGERVMWEDTYLKDVEHLPEAIVATRMMATQFVEEAAKNPNRFESEEYLSMLLIEENYDPEFLQWGLFYVFDSSSLDQVIEDDQ